MNASEENWALVRELVGEGGLSVVMPSFNLDDTIAANLELTADLFERHRVKTELVPVDDGSSDGTAAALAGFRNERRFVTVRTVICPRNGGKGSALRAGFEASTGAYVMLLDGDLDIHPRQTPFFFAEMVAKGADIVVGSKRHPLSDVVYPWHRRIVSWVYFTLVRMFIGLKITDTQTGMKLFRREVLGEALARMLVKTYAFDLELLAIAHQRGARIAEAPVVIRFGERFGCLKPSTVRSMANDSLAVFYRLRVLNYYAKAEVPRRLERNPFVTAVIACPRESWMLDECLTALRAQSYCDWEAIVLPDGPLEGVADGERIRVLPTGKVRPAEKRNLGIREARGEIVAFIDDDAYADAHWLEYAVKYFSEPSVGAVGGPGVTPPGDGYLSRLGGRVYDNLLVSGNYRYRYRAGGVRRDVDDYPSCNLLVRRDLLNSFGGYRTDFWPGEDTLLCKDIIAGGKRIVYDPWVVVCHHRRALFAPHLRQLGRYAFHRGYFVKRYPDNSRHLSYFIPSVFVLYCVTWPVALALLVGPWFPVKSLLVFDLLCAYVAGPMSLYLGLLLLTTFSFNPLTWLLSAVGVFATHFTYGVQFVRGLCAKRAPCEFIGKDHV